MLRGGLGQLHPAAPEQDIGQNQGQDLRHREGRPDARHAEELAQAQVVIAIAGMEGALASVIGGLVSCPVIAVPTSVGYGASFGGVAALLAMLNSCASGVSVVNIDNGFGAAYQASLINHLSAGASCTR